MTVIGYYGRPDPQGENRIKAIAEWQAIQQIAYKAHGKDQTVILAGDYNMSYNTDAHRHRVGNDWTQHTMLHLRWLPSLVPRWFLPLGGATLPNSF